VGYKLLDAIKEGLKNIKSNPFAYQIKYGVYRTKLIPPFPYVLVYEIIEKDVVVYQFFAAKKNPTKRYKK